MSDVLLGIKPAENAERDAIHVAIIPVVAREKLRPGDRVNKHGELSDEPVGIVDPFLDDDVQEGETFWLCLFQRTVTGMRHHWEHPAFDKKPTKEESLDWIKNFANTHNTPDYRQLILAAIGEPINNFKGSEYGSYYIDDDYFHFSGQDASGKIPPEFWEHVENYTGKKCLEKPKYFSCSC